MYFLLISLHILVALALVLIVLLQPGKGGGSLGSVFGGGSQAIFGPRGAGTFLTKLTTAMAITFMITSLLLAVLSSQPQTSSIMSRTKEKGHHTGKHSSTGVPSIPSQSQAPSTPQGASETKTSTTPSTKP